MALYIGDQKEVLIPSPSPPTKKEKKKEKEKEKKYADTYVGKYIFHVTYTKLSSVVILHRLRPPQVFSRRRFMCRI